MQKKTVEYNPLVLCYTRTHVQWSWKFLRVLLRYAENKCCLLISKNTDLAHGIPLD